jgi:Domain of Unknown Function (DUF748)
MINFLKSKRFVICLITVLSLLLVLWLMLPSILLRYVNQTLDRIPDYEAKIEAIDVSLWRGAYIIRNLRMIKKGGQEKYPFLQVPKIDLSIEWPALWHGKVVGAVRLLQPTMNFIQAPSKEKSQLTAGTGWAEQGKKLFPFEINRFIIQNGTITFRELEMAQGSDLKLTSVHLEMTGITNLESKERRLPVHLEARAIVFDSGRLSVNGSAQLLRDPISFDINTSIETVDLTKLNPYVKHHAGFDFKAGNFALYSNLRANEGKIEGYVKPLFENISIDIEDSSNPVEFFWKSVVSIFVELFSNQPKDRFATVIPISGSVDDPQADLWSTVINVIRNAFIKAFIPNFEKPSPP